MNDSPSRLRATQLLHCNLNVADVERAAAMYETALGLSVRMRSETVDGDSTMLGIDGPTHSIVWFLYDHRGGHVSPSIELAEWRSPLTIGEAHEDPRAIGLVAAQLTVPSLSAAIGALTTAGATQVASAEVLDLDGVRLELIQDPSVTAATFTALRLNCLDLAQSCEWYGVIGWERRGDVEQLTRDGNAARVQRVALPTHPFELHLTCWDDGPLGPAHDAANTRGLYRMALAVDDVRGAYDESRQHPDFAVGEPVYVPLPGTPLGGLWVSFFRDPNGVTVELVERKVGRR